MKKQSRNSRYRDMKIVFLLLILVGVGLWHYQSDSNRLSHWSWEDQVRMEVAMAHAAEASPGVVPEIDRSIPQTETALFALG